MDERQGARLGRAQRQDHQSAGVVPQEIEQRQGFIIEAHILGGVDAARFAQTGKQRRVRHRFGGGAAGVRQDGLQQRFIALEGNHRHAQGAHGQQFLRGQFQDLVGVQQAAQCGREAVEQGQALGTLVQFLGAAQAVLEQARIFERHRRLAGESGGDLDMFIGVEIGLGFFEGDQADHFAFGHQWDAHPRKARRFQRGEARVCAHIPHGDGTPGADHFLEQGAVGHTYVQAEKLVRVREAARRVHGQLVFFPHPQRGSLIGQDGRQLVEQGGDQFAALQAGGDGGGHVGERLQLAGAFFRGLHQPDVFEGERHLLRKRHQQGFIAGFEGRGRVEVIQRQHAQVLPARQDGDEQAGDGQAAAGHAAVAQKSVGAERIVARQVQLVHAAGLPACEDRAGQGFAGGEGDFLHPLVVGIPGNGARRQPQGLGVPQQHRPGVGGGDDAAGAVEQGAQDGIRVQSAQLAAEIEQEVHFLQAAACFAEQGNILQNNRGLARDLVIDLAILVGQAGHRFGRDGQDAGHDAILDFDGQADNALGAQAGQERGVAPFIVFLQAGDDDRLARLQDRAQGIALAKERFRVGVFRRASQDLQQARPFGRFLGDQRHRHAQLGQHLASQRQERRGRVQLAADGFGDGQPGADTLGAAIQVMDGDGLVEVLAQERGQVVLCDGEQALLALQAGIQRVNAAFHLQQAALVEHGQFGLRGKDLQRAQRGAVGTQAVARRVHAQQAERLSLWIFERDQQEILRIPVLRGFGAVGGVQRYYRMHVRGDYGGLVGGNEIGMADLEFGAEQLLDALQGLFAREQFLQRLGGQAHARHALELSAFRFVDAEQRDIEWRGLLDGCGDREQGLVERAFEIGGRGNFRKMREGGGAPFQLFGGQGLFLEAARIAQCNRGLQCQGLERFERGLVEKIRGGCVQVDHAQCFALVCDRHNQRRTCLRVRGIEQGALEIGDQQRLAAGEYLPRQRG